jgi:hypothetical protein
MLSLKLFVKELFEEDEFSQEEKKPKNKCHRQLDKTTKRRRNKQFARPL